MILLLRRVKRSRVLRIGGPNKVASVIVVIDVDAGQRRTRGGGETPFFPILGG